MIKVARTEEEEEEEALLVVVADVEAANDCCIVVGNRCSLVTDAAAAEEACSVSLLVGGGEDSEDGDGSADAGVGECVGVRPTLVAVAAIETPPPLLFFVLFVLVAVVAVVLTLPPLPSPLNRSRIWHKWCRVMVIKVLDINDDEERLQKVAVGEVVVVFVLVLNEGEEGRR